MELSGAHSILSEWKCRNYFEMRGGKGRRRRKREEGIEDTQYQQSLYWICCFIFCFHSYSHSQLSAHVLNLSYTTTAASCVTSCVLSTCVLSDLIRTVML